MMVMIRMWSNGGVAIMVSIELVNVVDMDSESEDQLYTFPHSDRGGRGGRGE